MLPANIVAALQTLVNSARPSPQALSGPGQGATIKLEPGQQLQASVESKLADGMFKVQVAGQAMQMHLPASVRSGDTIMLQVVATQPKITFSMAASTTPLSLSEQIGSTARLLSNLAGQPTERPIVQQAGDKAIWAATQQAPDVKQLASGLREALGKSGLFYESHQAQWIRGERTTSQLLEEPQNLLTGRTLPLSSGSVPMPSQDKLPAPQQPQTTVTPQKTDSDTALPINKELIPLVQQQLHTLETHHMVWMGQIWTGQQMQWQIQGEPKRQEGRDDERQWSTEMELSLPKLGDVRATLSFTGQGVNLTLHADATTAEQFNRALPQLRDALDNAGITLQTAKVIRKP